jgi:starch-binding outer membrane protein SusE/F
MKIINKILSMMAIVALFSCEKDELKAVLNSTAKPGLNASATNLVLEKAKENGNALTLTWVAPELGFKGGLQYTLLIDKKGNGFKSPQAFNLGTGLTKSWTHKQLNALLQAMGYKGVQKADLEAQVQSILSTDVVQNSDIIAFTAISYQDKLDLKSTWGLVGSATPGGWNGPDVPFFKTNKSGVFVCYAKLVDGDIKIRENNDWAVNYGDNGADGSLEKDGANLVVKAGSYAITFDVNTLKYSIEKLSWGIVGSGAPNGWNGPDLDFFYDPTTDQWRAFANLADGEIKFRKSNDWGLNYGDTGANGTLEANGDNIAVKKGVYLVTLNLNELKYTIEKTDIPGIVGSAAPKGWDGPDVSMIRDFERDNVWVAYGVTLAAGEMKFRMNNDWGVNYGGSGGNLTKNGANIAVAAGKYDIELDLSNTETPTYKITKK